MKVILVFLLLISSISAFANTKPCLSQARKEVNERLGEIAEEYDCEVKLSKVNQSDDEVSYSAKISCVGEDGFFDMADFVALKYEKLASGKYSCKVK